MLRMFDFIALTQSKIAGLVDSSRSTEITLEERNDGTWAYEKVDSRMVFKHPFLGQDSIRSVQAVHLYQSGRGWLIAEMEELEGPASPVNLRRGMPEGVDTASPLAASDSLGRTRALPGSGSANRNLFPVSPRAPERAGEADRLRYRLRLKNGAALSRICVLGPEQKLVRAVSASEWILENRRPTLALGSAALGSARPGGAAPGRAEPKRARPPSLPSDSMHAYLASNGFLILEDTLLITTAARIVGNAAAAGGPGDATDPRQVTAAIYRWVMEHFRFQLGAVLFGTSAEILRGMTGDCSEAAVLTAALLRSRGVPARVALGFASLGRGVFIGHAWCEAWLDGRWVGADAALREFPAGVERVKLATLDGRVDMRIAATNLMMQALSNLDIEILDAWKDGKPLALADYPDNSAEAGKFFEDILRGLDKSGIEGKMKNEK